MEQKKIAFVTDDGSTVCAHFGRAMYYEIFTLDGTTIVSRERGPKAGHHTNAPHAHAGEQHHGHDHGDMIAPIRGCATLVARGMGMGAHVALQSAGITTVLTDEQFIEAALQKYTAGELTNNARRLHDHGPGHAH
jgi:predicted Fe-Mo cluster-binding NifX family protein